jgi:membrane associated rhomboid family serine protease
MLMLYFFGTMVEGRGALGFDAGGAGHGGRYLGRTGIIKLYLGSGAVGGLLFVVVSALFGEPATPVIGASGAVYGIMMYAACIDPRRPIHLIFISVEIRYLVGFLVFVGLYSSYIGLFQSGGGDGVAHSAHLGGALWGYLAYRLGRSGRAVSETGLLAFWRHRRAAAQRRSAERSQATLDRILEKVHRDGMSDLSAAERRFLERVSKDARK